MKQIIQSFKTGDTLSTISKLYDVPSQAIADLLELNYSTAEGKEQTSAAPETGGGEAPPPAEPTGPGAAELGPELAAAEEETPAEETPPAEA